LLTSPGGYSLKHFTRIIKNKTRRVRDGLLPEITEQDCSEQMKILSDVLLPELDEALFAIAHGDLSPQNILIDAYHNIIR
jgi:Ser/Thr protein kinase RdoA (MazF antagonist)